LLVLAASTANSSISPWTFECSTILQATHTASMSGSASATRVMSARSSRVLSRRSPVWTSKTLMAVMPGANQVCRSSIWMKSLPARFQMRALRATESSASRTDARGNFTRPSAETSQPAPEKRSRTRGSGSNCSPDSRISSNVASTMRRASASESGSYGGVSPWWPVGSDMAVAPWQEQAHGSAYRRRASRPMPEWARSAPPR
jgi:hypothetical protein